MTDIKETGPPPSFANDKLFHKIEDVVIKIMIVGVLVIGACALLAVLILR